MKTTVFICTYNRGNLINGTLDSIVNHQIKNPDEIVIVNGGGDNDCQKYLEIWEKDYPNIKIIQTKNKNLAASRNIGLPYCSGDLILQTDDDARPSPDWINQSVKMHQKYPDCGVIGGSVIDASQGKFLNKIADSTTFPKYEKVQRVRSVAGVNSSYKKEVIKAVGDYDETLFRGEDVDYNWRAIKKGWIVLFCPEVKVKHLHRPSWRGLLNQHYMYGRAYYLVRKKWPTMYSYYPKKIISLMALSKLIASWTFVPLSDACNKARINNKNINGFEILTILLINMINRIGVFYQRHFAK